MTRFVSVGITVVLVSAVLLASETPSRAQAQERSFNPQLFHVAPGPDTFVTVEPAAPLRHKSWALGLAFNYARNPFSILGYDSERMQVSGTRANIQANVLAADLWAAVGVINRLQFALALPMTLYQNGQNFVDTQPAPDGTTIVAPRGFAFGDPRIHIKALLYGKDTGAQLALSHWLAIPLGNDKQFGGEKHYTGFSGEARALFNWEGGRWRLGASVGILWRAHESQFFSTTLGQQLTYAGAVAVDVVASRLTVVAEVYGYKDFTSNINVSPLELGVSAKIGIIHGLGLTAGISNGIVAGLGSPQPRAFLAIAYVRDTRDKDKDGVPDAIDGCPDNEEDKDGWKDSDGCPEPDNDSDGILDKADKCPNEAEDKDRFQDEDGCPDPDNDKDGIDDLHDACPLDAEDGKPPYPKDGCPTSKNDTDADGVSDGVDKCPSEQEDRDGFQDDDGCLDPDNDNDGIPDSFDECPNAPEDFDGYQDEDGCPDPDNDFDGILDKGDKCPNKPETINGREDDDGCPDTGTKINFEKGATLDAKSLPVLDGVAKTIKALPAELRIRIEGHTDSLGNAGQNLQLSTDRAEAVRDYLIKQGVPAERLVAAGYGGARPVGDNKHSVGRDANRRIEFRIIVTNPKAPKEDEETEPQ